MRSPPTPTPPVIPREATHPHPPNDTFPVRHIPNVPCFSYPSPSLCPGPVTELDHNLVSTVLSAPYRAREQPLLLLLAVPKLLLRRQGRGEPREQNCPALLACLRARIFLAKSQQLELLFEQSLEAFPASPWPVSHQGRSLVRRCKAALHPGRPGHAAAGLRQTGAPPAPAPSSPASARRTLLLHHLSSLLME